MTKYTGNVVPQVTANEHDEVLAAKRTSMVSAATIYAVVNAGSGGTSKTDDSAFTAGSDSGTPAMGVYQDSEDSVNDGDAGVIGMTANRWLKTSLQSAATVYAVVNTAAAGQSSVVLDTSSAWIGLATVDIGSSLPAGTNAIGKLAANSGVDIGDVDILSIAAGDNNIGNVDLASEIPVGTKFIGLATVVQGGALPAGSNAIGKLAANSGVDIGDVDILSIAAGDNNIGNVDIASAIPAGDNNIGNVDIASALPAGSNAIGKLAANSGVDIGDVDVTSVVPGTAATNLGKAEDAAHSSGDTGVMALGVRQDTPNTAVAGTDADYTPVAVSSTGAVRNAPPSEDFAALANGPQVKKYYTATTPTDGIVWSPAAGKRWYVTDMVVSLSAAGTVTFEDDKAGGDEVVMLLDLAANSGIAHSFNTPLFSGEDAADLVVTVSAGTVYITVTGYEI